jgi:hypothetical protein
VLRACRLQRLPDAVFARGGDGGGGGEVEEAVEEGAEGAEAEGLWRGGRRRAGVGRG